MRELEQLWGGTLLGVVLDIPDHRLELKVDLDSQSVVKLTCLGVREAVFFDPHPAIWDYAEITEAVGRRMPDGSVTLEFKMWVDEAGLRIKCADVRIETARQGSTRAQDIGS